MWIDFIGLLLSLIIELINELHRSAVCEELCLKYT